MEYDETAEPPLEYITGSDYQMFNQGWRNFYRKNMLMPKTGAREEGCPPGTTRTNIPRSTVYDVDAPENKRPKINYFNNKPLPPR